MKPIANAEKVAWISSISACVLSAALGGTFIVAAMKSAPKTPTLNDAQKQALQKKIMLQARIELCAMRDRGELPKNSTQCDEGERKNLDAYRKQIEELEETLRATK